MWRYLAMLLCVPVIAAADPLPVVDFQSISRNHTDGNHCAVTFDDGPGDHTAKMLDILAEHNISATFFVLGKQVRRNPDLVRRMIAEGHEVANHSFNHPKMRTLSPEQQADEIRSTQDILRPLGARPTMFRPPYGNYDARTIDIAAHLGLRIVLWSHDSLDWRYHSLAALEGQILPQKPRQQLKGIYLFHDTHSSTVAAMPSILSELRSKGCSFVTVSQWLNLHPQEIQDEEQTARHSAPPAMPVVEAALPNL